MTESKFHSRNTHTDTIPVSEQLIPHTRDEGVDSKEIDTPPKETFRELARRTMTIVLGFFTMIAMVYPILIIPGTVIIILPIEVIIVDRIYGEIIHVKELINTPLRITNTIDDFMEKDQIRVSAYGRRAPA